MAYIKGLNVCYYQQTTKCFCCIFWGYVIMTWLNCQSILGAKIPSQKYTKTHFNSLALGRCGSNFTIIIFKIILQNCSLDSWHLLWNYSQLSATSLIITCIKKLTLVQVMAWCCQITSHYLSQCWPRYMFYGITRPLCGYMGSWSTFQGQC